VKKIRIGCGAGYAGDRIDPAVDLAKKCDLDYLVLECLAERTTAMAQIEKQNDASKGYGPFLEERMTKLLPLCKEKGFRIITNIGAANPKSALIKTAEIARNLNLESLKIAAVLGSDVLDTLQDKSYTVWETGKDFREIQDQIISADAYLGVEEILPALMENADVIITGRVSDPSLFLAPMVYEFNWSLEDWHKLGMGTVIGHLMECAAQVTGGYFADPIYKEVEDLAHVGFPFVEVSEDGTGILSKTPGSGGAVTIVTCKEQLLYEIHDPSAYKTPDVIADFSSVSFREIASNKIEISGGTGEKRPDTLKVTLGVNNGFLGEGTICYGGHHALERARMAENIIKTRFAEQKVDLKRVKYEIVGLNSLHGSIGENGGQRPYEVMLRVAALSDKREEAVKVGNEVEALWLNGPGGPGGVRKYTQTVISANSTTIHRNEIKSNVIYQEV
jgi:hypothetical protein